MMSMQQHILQALREQLDQWEELLAGLSADQIATPLAPSHWSIQDVVVHLRAWQQRSVARFEAAQLGREPAFPEWAPGLDPEDEDSTEPVNAWIYESGRDLSWTTVHREWRETFERLLELGASVPERDLLDGGLVAWQKGWPLALVLLGTYDHHQEHLQETRAWLKAHPGGPAGG